MSAGWAYFWPLLAAGIVLGMIVGLYGFRRRKRWGPLAAGATAAIVAAWLWHAPLGAADAFRTKVERDARVTLDNYEMTQVDARLQRDPLTRTLSLKGQADDFQRGELVRVMSSLEGVRKASWAQRERTLPLILEGLLTALLGYLVGLLVAYLVELRRRYNAQWKW